MNVSLTREEVALGASVGCARRIRAIAKNLENRHGYNDSDNWTVDIDGALAENAVAKAFGIFWTDYGNVDVTDVGPYHVRSTSRANGCLILHHSDPDDGPFILATGREQKWTLQGWILGGKGKQERFWRTEVREPAFFVPQSALRPMSELAQ